MRYTLRLFSRNVACGCTFTMLLLSNWIDVAHFSGIKRSSSRHGRGAPTHLHIVFWLGRVSIFEHKQNAENVAHSLPIHRDRRCTDVYVRTPRHLTLDGEAFHCAVGHAFLRMPDWYAEVSSGMQRHPIFADRSRLRPREFRLLHTASQTAPAGFKSAPWTTASKSDTWFYSPSVSSFPLPSPSLFPFSLPLSIVPPSHWGHSRRIRIHPAPSARSIRITLHYRHDYRVELRRWIFLRRDKVIKLRILLTFINGFYVVSLSRMYNIVITARNRNLLSLKILIIFCYILTFRKLHIL